MKKLLYVIITLFIFGAGVLTGGLLVAFNSPPVVTEDFTKGYPTSYEVLTEMNNYRRENGLKDLELYQPLCNNIAERWENYKKNNSHEGLQEFINKWMREFEWVDEILVAGTSAQQMVDKWSTSPSHDLPLRKNSKVCVYSAEGYTVALLAN